nr:putative phage tail fiber protein [uncultured Mediterranean phage uvMED]
MSYYSVTGTDARNAAETAQAAAESAKAAAESAKAAAEAALDYVDDRNLGAKASDPTVDNDGNALLTGAQYFNTSDNTMRVYNGTAWQLTAPVGALINSNNLSDVSSVATARSNLGLGTVATTDASAYATAAQADQTVALTAGTGLSISGTYPNFTLVNSAPDQTLSLTGAGATSISGTYPNFTITSTNTTYSIGDGGLTQNNFTDALLTKLNGIETSADVTDTANVVNALTAGTDINIAADGTISSTATASANTTYQISWVDSNNDAILRLTPSSGSNDDLSFIAGTNITLTPSGDNLTFATNATVNDSDANLKNRANHTGTQAISTVTGLQTGLDSKEPAITKNTAFNKDFGTASGTVAQGNDSRLSDSRVCNNSFDDADTAKANLSLDNVENKSSATIRSEIVDSDIPASIARDTEVTTGLSGKVDKVTGKDLSTHDLTTALKDKLVDIEAGADVTDTANVTAAGALMDSEVDADIKTLTLPANTTISSFGQTLIDDADAATARTTLGLGSIATTASTDYATAAQGTKADNALPKSGGAMTGAITTNSTIAGRDIAADGNKLDDIEDQATADQTDPEIETAYNNQVAQVSSAERTAGTETGIRRLSPADVKSMVDQHSGSVSVTSTAVDNAGAVMNTDTTTASMGFVIDEDDFSSDSATKVPTQQSVKAYIASYLDRVGTYIWSDTQPAHTLPCNGNTYNRSDYAVLYAKRGPSGSNTLGPGNGTTTFNTLDPRGRLPRVTDDGKGVDPDASSRSAMFSGTASGDAPGSIQDDRNASHHHFAFNDSGATSSSTSVSSTLAAHDFHGLGYSSGDFKYEILGTLSEADVGKTSTQGGSDARPRTFGTRIWVYYE